MEEDKTAQQVHVVATPRTADYLSNYEASQIVSRRIEEMSKTNVNMLTTEERQDLSTFEDIAKRELLLNKCPYKVRRPLGVVEGTLYVEVRDPNRMVKPRI